MWGHSVIARLLLPDYFWISCVKKKKSLLEVHSFLEIFHTRSYKPVLSVLDSQEAVCFGCVGWFFFFPAKKNGSSLCMIYSTLKLPLPSYTSRETDLRGAEDDGISMWDKCVCALRDCWLYHTVSFEALSLSPFLVCSREH